VAHSCSAACLLYALLFFSPQVRDPELQALLGEARFFSITYRLFKLEGVETTCEDYGQACKYKVGRAAWLKCVPAY